MGIFTWPVWSPYPVNWLRAVGNLFLWAVLTEGMLEAVFKNRDYALAHCWIDEFGNVDCPSAVSQGAFLLFCFLLNLVFQAIAITITHHWIARLRGKSRGWFPRWPSWREGLNGSIAVFLSFVAIAVPGILFVAIFPQWLTIRALVPVTLGGMLAIAAYLHQYDCWVRERRAAKKAMRSQARTGNKKRGKKREFSPSGSPANLTPPPVDPIDLELDRLRGEMGMNQMRRKKPPENSQ